ncbi:MAG: hypothetical protein ABSG03_41705 [Bryobacteraceae bacterium]|jgi:hypothetical protein
MQAYRKDTPQLGEATFRDGVRLRVQWRRPRLRFDSGRFDPNASDAAQIYNAITSEIERSWKPEHTSLTIGMDGLDWLVDVLNARKMPEKHLLDEYRALQFQLLRYETFLVAKEIWA